MAASNRIDDAFWQVPRLRRDQRWLAGVAAAIGRELGVDALLIRLAFVLFTLMGGTGLALYAAAWLWFTFYARTQQSRAYVPVAKAKTPARRVLGVALVVGGVLLLGRNVLSLSGDAALWPVAVAVFGMLLAWSSGKVDWSAPYELVRAVGGLGLVAVGVIGFIALNFGLAVAPKALLISTAVLAAVVLIVAPWLWRAASQVSEERLKRTRADERAEVAAHLHDSVLQTLSLIQRNADDRAATVSLARRQERELREWLFGRSTQGKAQELKAALSELACSVEELHGVLVEVVVVGDGPLDERMATTLAATREAIVNAAKHSGATRVDVFAELDADKLEVFVRDTGRGFDPSSVPEDRRGLAESVVRRMQRAGGSASVTSELGRGTEVVLELPRLKDT